MPSPSEEHVAAQARVDTHEIVDAQVRGRDAALAGADSGTCPWRNATPHDLTLMRQWLRGWAAGRTDLRRAQDLAGPVGS